MALSQLTPHERDAVLRCLRAAADGPFFPDWEFHTLFGIERADVAAVAARWPDVNDTREVVQAAIINSLNNLLGYPHGEAEAFIQWIGAPVEEVERIFSKWRKSCGLSS
jgi:hypothetical protein